MQIHGTPASLPELHPHREDRWTKTGILWQAASNGNSVGGYAKRSRMLVTEENAHLTWPQESESVAHHGLSLTFMEHRSYSCMLLDSTISPLTTAGAVACSQSPHTQTSAHPSSACCVRLGAGMTSSMV